MSIFLSKNTLLETYFDTNHMKNCVVSLHSEGRLTVSIIQKPTMFSNSNIIDSLAYNLERQRSRAAFANWRQRLTQNISTFFLYIYGLLIDDVVWFFFRLSSLFKPIGMKNVGVLGKHLPTSIETVVSVWSHHKYLYVARIVTVSH